MLSLLPYFHSLLGPPFLPPSSLSISLIPPSLSPSLSLPSLFLPPSLSLICPLSPSSLIAELEDDYADLGLVEFWSDESQDISQILGVKDTTKDKLTYTVSQ